MSDLQETQEANEIQDREMMEKMGDAVNKREEEEGGQNRVRAPHSPKKAPLQHVPLPPQNYRSNKGVSKDIALVYTAVSLCINAFHAA